MGNQLRSALFTLFQMLVTPIYALLVLALFWLPRVPRYRFITGWCALNLWAARRICGIRSRVIGAEHIPATPCVVACKHNSTWETLFMSRLLPPLAYVAKKELRALPFFGWAFALASPITIDRNAGRDAMAQMVEQAGMRFEQGFWIAVYPEGTRIRAGTRAHYKTGAARIAIALAVPILPIAHNAGWVWPKGRGGKRAGTITMSIGTPIDSTGQDPSNLTATVEEWIEGEVARIGRPG